MTGRNPRLLVRRAATLLDRHRRLASALCAAGAVGVVLSVVAPAPVPTVPVLAAAAELPAGHVLARSDLRLLALPPDAVPAGALTAPAGAIGSAAAIGRSVALPMRKGEVLTDVRLAGSPLLAAATAGGLVGVPVRIADAAAVALLQAGDRVDVLGASDNAPAAVVVAGDALVVMVPAAADGAFDDGALVVLATTAQTSQRLAHAAITARLSVVLRN